MPSWPMVPILFYVVQAEIDEAHTTPIVDFEVDKVCGLDDDDEELHPTSFVRSINIYRDEYNVHVPATCLPCKVTEIEKEFIVHQQIRT